VLRNGNMRGESEAMAAMRAVPVQFQQGRILGLNALLKASEREALGRGIESIGASRQMTVGDIRPTVAIIASFEKGFAG